jgi:hypothetical protein
MTSRDTALRLLRKVRDTWRLGTDEWRQLETVLRRLGAASDDEAFNRALADLTLAGPRRIGQGVSPLLGQPVQHPASDNVRDLVNRLIHQIGPGDQPEHPRPEPGGRPE